MKKHLLALIIIALLLAACGNSERATGTSLSSQEAHPEQGAQATPADVAEKDNYSDVDMTDILVDYIGAFPDRDPDFFHVVVDDTSGEPLYLMLDAYP